MALPDGINLRKMRLYCKHTYDYFYYDNKTRKVTPSKSKQNLKLYAIDDDRIIFQNSKGRYIYLNYGINKDQGDYVMIKQQEPVSASSSSTFVSLDPTADENNSQEPKNENKNKNESAAGAGAGAGASSASSGRRKTRKNSRK